MYSLEALGSMEVKAPASRRDGPKPPLWRLPERRCTGISKLPFSLGVHELITTFLRREFGSDLLASISITVRLSRNNARKESVGRAYAGNDGRFDTGAMGSAPGNDESAHRALGASEPAVLR